MTWGNENMERMTTIIMNTSEGSITINLFDDKAPNTVANFLGLATGEKEWADPYTGQPSHGKFYNGLTFHRIIKQFMIQGGCPLGTGTGGPGYTIKCETSAPKQYHDRGVLSMAHAGKDTGGSQFFICMNRTNTAHLDGVHTCFGRVVEGLDVIDRIRRGDLILGIDIIKDEA